MITRAKCLMIIVGNTETLRWDKNWSQLINYCIKSKAIIWNGLNLWEAGNERYAEVHKIQRASIRTNYLYLPSIRYKILCGQIDEPSSVQRVKAELSTVDGEERTIKKQTHVIVIILTDECSISIQNKSRECHRFALNSFFHLFNSQFW